MGKFMIFSHAKLQLNKLDFLLNIFTCKNYFALGRTVQNLEKP